MPHRLALITLGAQHIAGQNLLDGGQMTSRDVVFLIREIIVRDFRSDIARLLSDSPRNICIAVWTNLSRQFGVATIGQKIISLVWLVYGEIGADRSLRRVGFH